VCINTPGYDLELGGVMCLLFCHFPAPVHVPVFHGRLSFPSLQCRSLFLIGAVDVSDLD
jgi:hypothetical protein